jgi:hypothetical protein
MTTQLPTLTEARVRTYSWNVARGFVRNRDDFQCRRCDLPEEEHRSELHVHHITPRDIADKGEGEHDPGNLVALCNSCHRIVEHFGEQRQLEEFCITSKSELRPDSWLHPVDRQLLGYLEEGRVTPAFARARMKESGEEFSRGYIQQRLKRLEEHSHLINLFDTGLYELESDPRQSQTDG